MNIMTESHIDSTGIYRNTPRLEQKIVAFALISYIYLPYFDNILENTFGVSPLVQYLIYLALALVPIFLTRKINIRVFFFVVIFLSVLLINYIVVKYKYYVMVEGFQALIGILPPLLCITCRYFDLSYFLKAWNKFAYYNIPLVILAIFLLKANLLHYSIFTGICVPNVFILSYGIMRMDANKKWAILISLLNIVITAALGGRMAAIASAMMLIIANLFSSSISLIKKIIFIAITVALGFWFINNLYDILIWMSKFLENYGIRSRSVMLMLQQLKTKELYTTNRDVIYSLTTDYIKERSGLPGGFGVALNLTKGKYYYVHNYFLQMFIIFGVFGTLIIFASLVLGFYYMRRLNRNLYRLLIFMYISYLAIGMTGSSIFIHYLSTIFISLFCFTDWNNMQVEG